MLLIYCVILIVQYLIVINAKWVVDVDSSIIDEINQNPSIGYLIKFHAPWFVNHAFFPPDPKMNFPLGVDIVDTLNLYMKKSLKKLKNYQQSMMN
jgi:hypothetical protein